MRQQSRSPTSGQELIDCVKEKNWEKFVRLLRRGKNGKQSLEYVDGWGNNSLHLLCRHAPKDIMELVLTIADDDALMTRNVDGCTPLHEAILYASEDIILIVTKACPQAASIANNQRVTPLQWAKERNLSPGIIDLLEVSADAEMIEEKCNSAILAGNIYQAIECYTKLIANDQSNYHYYSSRSAAYLMSGDVENALVDAETCLALNPKSPKAYARKAVALFYYKKYEEARDVYEEGLALFPKDADLVSGLTMMSERLTFEISEIAATETKKVDIAELKKLRRELKLRTEEKRSVVTELSDAESHIKECEKELRLLTNELKETAAKASEDERIRKEKLKESTELVEAYEKKLEDMKWQLDDAEYNYKDSRKKLISSSRAEIEKLQGKVQTVTEEKNRAWKNLSQSQARCKEAEEKLECIKKIITWDKKGMDFNMSMD